MSKMLFNDNWAMKASSGSMTDFGYYQPVVIPHDAIIGKPRDADAPSTHASGYSVGGVFDYKKLFDVPSEWQGKQIILELEGVYMNAEIKVNNNFVTLRPYGYSTFFVDISDYLQYGSKNKLVVRASNAAPHNSRWYTGAGIYRNVWLHIKEQVAFHPWGIQITTPKVSADESVVYITARGENKASRELQLKVDFKIKYGEETVISSGAKVKAKAKEDFAVEQKVVIRQPALWDLEHPNLYRLEANLEEQDSVLDKVEIDFGIRDIAFNLQQGFLLNGEPVKLKGGCVHHDNGILGSASYARAEERKIELMKAAGYNAIRTAHNPPSPAMLDACDRLGMLVMDEAFDMWRAPKGAYDYHLYFESWWQEDLQAMILRDFNHPSVIMWSVGNEILERDGSSDGDKWSRIIADYARELDNTRPITQGIIAVSDSFDVLEDRILSNWEINMSIKDDKDGSWGPRTENFVKPLDIVGYNYMSQRYEKDMELYPNRIIVGSETYPNTMYDFWQKTMAFPRVIGDFCWTAIDYLGEAGIGKYYVDTKPGYCGEYPWFAAGCGDIDICGFKRPQSYYRDIMWGVRSKPYIGVLSPKLTACEINYTNWGWEPVQDCWTYPGEEGKMVKVYVYSPDEEVELLLNGVSVGHSVLEKNKAIFEIPYEPGELVAIAYRAEGQIEKHILCTTGEAVGYILQPDRNHISTQGDLCYVTIEAVDCDGNRVFGFKDEIVVNVKGAGKLVALGNSNPVTEELYTDDKHSLYKGRALAIVRSDEQSGEIEICIASNKLPGVSCRIEVKS